jgi:zinc protease
MQSWVPDRSHDTFEIMYDRVPQVRSYRYWSVPGRTTRERFLLELAASVLGNGKNSRLYQALVYQNQLAVNVGVGVEEHQLASMFSIDVTLKPEATLEQVNSILDRELAKFLAEGPTAEELERVKTGINAGVVRGLEQIGGFGGKATALAQGELYAGNPTFFRTSLRWLNEASSEDVRKAAQQWLSDGRYQLDVLP